MLGVNADVRKLIKDAGLFLWQVGDKLNLNDGNFSRKLRKELTKEKKAEIMAIIEELKGADE
jgi:hypothetical protein